MAVAAPPLLLSVRVTVPIISPFCNPLEVNSVLPLPKVTTKPYVLHRWAFPVTVSGAGVMVMVPFCRLKT